MCFFFALFSSPDVQPQQTVTSQKPDKPEKPENNENGKGQTGTKPVHKWPIRPGVHVHVNGLHTLGGISTVAGGSIKNPDISGFSYGAKNSASCSGSDSASNTSQNDPANPVSEPDGGSDPVPDNDEEEPSKIARGTSTDSKENLNKSENISSNANNNNNNAKSQSNATPPTVSPNSSQVLKGIWKAYFLSIYFLFLKLNIRYSFLTFSFNSFVRTLCNIYE